VVEVQQQMERGEAGELLASTPPFAIVAQVSLAAGFQLMANARGCVGSDVQATCSAVGNGSEFTSYWWMNVTLRAHIRSSRPSMAVLFVCPRSRFRVDPKNTPHDGTSLVETVHGLVVDAWAAGVPAGTPRERTSRARASGSILRITAVV
jgi:hypothetical protein